MYSLLLWSFQNLNKSNLALLVYFTKKKWKLALDASNGAWSYPVLEGEAYLIPTLSKCTLMHANHFQNTAYRL